MEFEISNDSLTALRSISIAANFPELYEWLDTELEPYLTLAVTDETMPAAKTYRANLRKLKDRIEQYRKEAKAAALSSYNKFEADCKVATGKIDAAVENIDKQVKAAEERERQAKIAEIRAEYDAYENAEAREYCPWESIFSEKWGNKGYKIEDAKEEVLAKLNNTVVNLTSIRQIGGTDTAYLLDVYRSTHDINVVIRKQLELQAAKEREEQRRLAEEQRRQAVEAERREAERRGAAEQEKQAAPIIEETSFAETEPAEVEAEPILTVDFRVMATKKQLAGLSAYMKQNGIKYGKVV